MCAPLIWFKTAIATQFPILKHNISELTSYLCCKNLRINDKKIEKNKKKCEILKKDQH